MSLGLVWFGPEDGRLLLLVHGGATAYQCFDPVAPLFAEAGRRVVAYDRRGRGLSGDGTGPYSIEREVQDLIEVVAMVGGGSPVDVFGYSYGGTVSLLAAAANPGSFRRVVVYEPPFAGLVSDDAERDVVALLEKDDRHEALRQFVSRTFELPLSLVDVMQAHPLWDVSIAAAPTLAREFQGVAAARVPEALSVPVRVLVAAEGGNPGFRRFASAVPGADVVAVGGVPHFAIPTDTAAVADAVLSFTD